MTEYEAEFTAASREFDIFCRKFSGVWADIVIEAMGDLQEMWERHSDEPADIIYTEPN